MWWRWTGWRGRRRWRLGEIERVLHLGAHVPERHEVHVRLTLGEAGAIGEVLARVLVVVELPGHLDHVCVGGEEHFRREVGAVHNRAVERRSRVHGEAVAHDVRMTAGVVEGAHRAVVRGIGHEARRRHRRIAQVERGGGSRGGARVLPRQQIGRRLQRARAYRPAEAAHVGLGVGEHQVDPVASDARGHSLETVDVGRAPPADGGGREVVHARVARHRRPAGVDDDCTLRSAVEPTVDGPPAAVRLARRAAAHHRIGRSVVRDDLDRVGLERVEIDVYARLAERVGGARDVRAVYLDESVLDLRLVHHGRLDAHVHLKRDGVVARPRVGCRIAQSGGGGGRACGEPASDGVRRLDAAALAAAAAADAQIEARVDGPRRDE